MGITSMELQALFSGFDLSLRKLEREAWLVTVACRREAGPCRRGQGLAGRRCDLAGGMARRAAEVEVWVL